MCKWNIDIHLKSGATLHCHVENGIQDSIDVARKYFEGDGDTFNAFRSSCDKKQVFFRLGDVSAFEISIAGE